MTALHLPNNAATALERCWHMNSDLGKWLVYAQSGISNDQVSSLCSAAMDIYNREQLHEPPDSDLTELSFIAPAHEDHQSVNSIQRALDNHIRLLAELTAHNDDPDIFNKRTVYPFGFVIIEGDDWREKGVTVVHCEKAEDEDDPVQWNVDTCRMLVKDLGLALTTLSFGDDTFENVKKSLTHMDEQTAE